ncbi:hypothetical protein BpHYR1_036616 [Brachionus plicatilis]|uniref:Uncharacterized protein n=1 Tax=Brachionus plicatilis TaxID=10195 RepID=A0A3M7SGS9_BRAPC|nr:hypothetical protein BpHYR1_036616 [Brachionus plicatilis]
MIQCRFDKWISAILNKLRDREWCYFKKVSNSKFTFEKISKSQSRRFNELDSRAVSSGLIPFFSPLIIRVFLIKNYQIFNCKFPQKSLLFNLNFSISRLAFKLKNQVKKLFIKKKSSDLTFI